MICPKCGEDNSDTFRFCGMCGNLLETGRPAGALASNQPSNTPRTANAPDPLRRANAESAIRPANRQVPPISGPSMLGLNEPLSSPVTMSQPGIARPSLSQSRPSNLNSSHVVSEPPSMDSLRERSFSGLDSFFESEQPKTGGRRILLLIVLLVALGAAGWWTYGYLGPGEARKSETVTPSATVTRKAGETTADAKSDTKNDKPSVNTTAADATPASQTSGAQVPAPSAVVPESPSENAHPSPAVPQTNPDSVRESTTRAPAIPREDRQEKIAENHKPRVTPAKATKVPANAAVGAGDADFRKGEAYLYGRGVRENCDEAVKSLKSASAQSNAKARSAFGTMYATGHCVPRDLPTSYLWFALALKVDPNNQILEKDLSAVWNQMTPPERQLATRMKQ